ncbi:MULTISPECIES: EamA family transporter [unclassified Streptomyces]|uniref:EamA family transporter n=1 Tax=unclassified Streptomyces TaxID=2593676 RepID=UPI003369E36C
MRDRALRRKPGAPLLLSGGGVPLAPVGLALAAVAACCWAGYILVSSRTARRMSGGQGLALAVLWAGLLSAPYGVAHAGSALLDPRVLAVAALVAVSASVPPYSNLEALRRIPPRVFGVLTSMEPAAGALFGFLLLGQRLAWPQWLGITAVACASVAATFLGAGERRNSRMRAKGEPSHSRHRSRAESAPAEAPVD